MDVQQARLVIRAGKKLRLHTFFKFQSSGELPFGYFGHNLINHSYCLAKDVHILQATSIPLRFTLGIIPNSL